MTHNINNRTFTLEIKDEVFTSLTQISKFMKDSVWEEFRKNQDDILAETFMRYWKSYWTSMSHPHFTSEKKDNCNCLLIDSCDSFKAQIITKKFRKGVFIGFDSNTKTLPCLKGTLEFKYSNGMLSVKVISFDLEKTSQKYNLQATGEVEEDIERYINLFEQDLEKIKKHFEKMSLVDILENLFDTLYSRSISNVKGAHARLLLKVYTNGIYHFPDFNTASTKTKALVMRKAFKNANKVTGTLDVYAFAQGLYYAIAEKNLNTTVYKYDDACQVMLTFKKIKDYFEYSSVKFTTYAARKFRTSFTPSSLWDLLAK